MIMLKDNISLKLIVEDEEKLLTHSTGNTLPVDTSSQHLFGIKIQWNVKARLAYSKINVINHILSIRWKGNLCKIVC